MPQDEIFDKQVQAQDKVEDRVKRLDRFGPDFWKDDPAEEASAEDQDTEESDEVEEEEESEDEEESVEESDEEESEDEEEESDEEEEEKPPVKSDPQAERWDKELQAIQQLRATLERQIASAQSSGTISQKDAAKIEKTQSKLAALLESKGKDFDPFEDARGAFSAVDEELQARDAKIAALEQKLVALEGTLSASKASVAEVQFDKQHPELAGRYSELAEKAAIFAEEIVGDDRSEAANNIWKKVASKKMSELIEAEKKAAGETQEVKPSVKKKAVAKKAKPKAKPKATNVVKKPRAIQQETLDPFAARELARKKYGF